MQSGERERAGSSKQRVENNKNNNDKRTGEMKKTNMLETWGVRRCRLDRDIPWMSGAEGGSSWGWRCAPFSSPSGWGTDGYVEKMTGCESCEQGRRARGLGHRR